MPIRFLVLKQWRQRPLRIAITIISVVIAVASLLGSSTAQKMVRSAEQKLQESLEGKPALEVSAAAGGRFDPNLVKVLADDPRVAQLAPLAYRTTTIRTILPEDSDERVRKATVLILGADLNKLSKEQRAKVETGAWPEDNEQLLIDEAYAKQLKLNIGDQLKVLAPNTANMTVVGFLKSDGLKEIRSGAVIIMPLTALQELFDLGSEVDRVRLEMGTPDKKIAHNDLAGLVPELQAKIPSDLLLRKPASVVAFQEETMRGTDMALNFATGLSFVMALFLVLNTLRMNFFERRRELAIVRAMGSSARDISRLLLCESLLIGVIGSILGIPAGWGLAILLKDALSQVLKATNLDDPQLTAGSILYALVVGVMTVVLGAWFTIRQSRNISPVEAMRDHEPATSEHYSLKLVSFAAVGWITAAIIMSLLRSETVPAWMAIPAGNLMLISFLTLIPVFLPYLLKGAAKLLFFGFPLFRLLAVEQLNRRRIRTGLTVGVLVVAVSSGLGLGNAIKNSIDDVYNWYEKSFAGDFFLKAVEGTTTEERFVELQKTLSDMPQIAERTELRMRPCKLGDFAALCIIRDLPDSQSLPWNMPKEESASLRQKMNSGEIVVSSVLARRANLNVGDKVKLELNANVVEYLIGGIVQDYINGGLILSMTTETAKKDFQIGMPNWIIIKTNKDAPQETQAALVKLADEYGWTLQSWAEMQANLDKMLNGLVAALWALIVGGFVVGGLGIMNTLTMNILEQTREIGLLRVMGMSKKQTLALVFVQVVLIVAMGLFIGAIAGVVTAFVIDWVSMPLLNREVPFNVHYDLIWFNLGVCVLIALISAILPALRAVKVRMITAVAYE